MQRWVSSAAFLLTLCAARAAAQGPDASPPSEAPPTAPSAEAATDGSAPGAAPEATVAPAAEPSAAESASLVPARAADRPKVAIVVVGDPEDALVAAAHALEDTLRADGRVALPADPAMRAALRGEGMSDGLDDVRATRRRLGRSESADVPVLAEVGRIVNAVLVIAVRASGASGLEAVAYDVSQMAFFDGSLDLVSATPERATTFVTRRAVVAAEGAAANAEPVDEPEAGEEGGASATAAEGAAAEVAPTPAGDPTLLWFEQNWAYFAAGALLAGGVAFLAVVLTDSGPPPPMLRFTPGGTTP